MSSTVQIRGEHTPPAHTPTPKQKKTCNSLHLSINHLVLSLSNLSCSPAPSSLSPSTFLRFIDRIPKAESRFGKSPAPPPPPPPLLIKISLTLYNMFFFFFSFCFSPHLPYQPQALNTSWKVLWLTRNQWRLGVGAQVSDFRWAQRCPSAGLWAPQHCPRPLAFRAGDAESLAAG